MKKLLLFTVILATSYLLPGQILTIDLAGYDPEKSSHKLNYDHSAVDAIQLKSVRPETVYTISYEVKKLEPEPIDYVAPAFRPPSGCDKLLTLLNEALMYATASDFAEKKWKSEHLDKIKAELKKGDCNDEAQVSRANGLLEQTNVFQSLNEQIKIERGEQLIIYVSRDNDKVLWKFIIDGAPVGKWLAHYGFGVASSLNQRGTYFCEATDNPEEFIVSKKEGRGLEIEYLPSILFSFIPYDGYNKQFVWSLTGGLGANKEDIAVLFGLSTFFWHNLGINLHLVGKSQHVLDGKYKEDGTSKVTEFLDFNQLHEEKFSLYGGFTISFRFESNPFTKAAE